MRRALLDAAYVATVAGYCLWFGVKLGVETAEREMASAEAIYAACERVFAVAERSDRRLRLLELWIHDLPIPEHLADDEDG